LLDGPSTGVERGVRNLKDVHLTKYKVPIRVGQRTNKVKTAYEEAKINDLWQKSAWAQKLQKRQTVSLIRDLFYPFFLLQRAGLNDFERFKVSRVKQLRNRIIRQEYGKLRKAANKA
jgi:large subunit ribosomal protein L14e